jgi:hypothetical protein
MSNLLLKAALHYARMGWPVFPLHSPYKNGCSCGNSKCTNIAKHPRTVHGFKDATTDEKQIRKWWKKWPKANIGIRTGVESGIVVLDVDAQHGGARSLQLLEKAHGGLLPCPTVRTGGGGRHKYLSHPGVPIKSKTGIAPGLDIRGDGGYVVAPPSRHSSGKRYEWSEHAHLDQTVIPLLPQWLQELVAEPAPKHSKTNDDSIQEGDRNVALTSLAGAVRRHGATEETILAALRKHNEERCDPPLPDKELETIAASVSKYPPAEKHSNRGPSQATQLVASVSDVRFFHTPENEPYVTIGMGEHHETWRLREVHFKRWLARCMYMQTGAAPSSQALNDALGLLEAMALFEGPTEDVFVRLGQSGDKIYLDLCNEAWQVIEISGEDWKVVSESPIKFRRARGMKPLPIPQRGGAISELRSFINLAGENDFVLLVSWLVAAFNPRGPYPVAVLQGEAGSAKSTGVRVIRELLDPNTTPLRSEPRETRDLMIAAQNAWCIAFDNVSHLGWRLSDDLCRLATGGGFSTRRLYTDDEEKLFEATRPLLLNGIEGVVSRGDLIDRSLVVYLPVIPEDQRRPEREFWKDFRIAQPRIFGALLDAVVCASRRLEEVKLERLPRMADFARWMVAAEPSLGWPEGTFVAAYDANRRSANTLALEASLIVRALRHACVRAGFKGTSSELLRKLNKHADTQDITQKAWPKDAWALSKQLRGIAPNLRPAGLDVRFDEKTPGSGSKRIITITRVAPTKPEDVAQGWKGPDGIWRFPFPRVPKEQTASQSSESDA